MKDAESYYRWCAGISGEYPITTEQFHSVTQHMAFAAVEDDTITGFFTLRRPSDDPDILRFGFVIVNPDKRGQGYGKRILMEGIRYAKEICDVKKITLGVFENNPSAYIGVIAQSDLLIQVNQ